MPRRPRITVAPTVEGVGVGFIACCLLASSFIQRVNLLVLVFGLLTALLVVGLFQARRNLRQLTAKRILPNDAFAGLPFDVGIEMTNVGNRDSFAATVEDANDVLDAPEKETLFPRIARGTTTKGKYSLVCERRGKVTLGPMTLSTRFPFGLFTASTTVDAIAEVVVYPALGEMSDLWRRSSGRASDMARNARPSPERRQEEFHGLRDYRDGDNLRHIHWLTTARRGQPVVKEFETLSSRDVLIFVDPFVANEAALHDESAELAISVAATACVDLCRRLGAMNGRVILVIAGPEPVVVQGQASARLAESALRSLALAEYSADRDWSSALDKLGPNQCRSAQPWFIGSREMEGIRQDYATRFGFRTALDAAALDVTKDSHRAYFAPIKTPAPTTAPA